MHRFSNALGLVTFVSFIKQTLCLLSVSTSCSHKHLGPLPAWVYLCQPSYSVCHASTMSHPEIHCIEMQYLVLLCPTVSGSVQLTSILQQKTTQIIKKLFKTSRARVLWVDANGKTCYLNVLGAREVFGSKVYVNEARIWFKSRC